MEPHEHPIDPDECEKQLPEGEWWRVAPKEKTRSYKLSRRRLFTSVARTAVAAAALSAGVVLLRDESWRLRPPGAGDEDDFLSKCIRCGLCAQNCPYDVVLSAGLSAGVAMGTPYLDARTGACQLCPDLPCIKACPTTALDPLITDVKDVKMGLAVIVDREACLAIQGLRCEICYRVCPLLDDAISLELRTNPRTGKHAFFEPVVHSEGCVGCGRCEEACPTDEAAIKVLSLATAKGKLGEHYRLGWKEESV